MNTFRSSRALLLAAALTGITPAFAQNAALNAAASNAAMAPLQAALADGAMPLQIQVSALDASWRRFKPGAALSVSLETLLSDFKREDAMVYSFVTRGETLSVGGETFLIAYRGQINLDAMDDATRLSLQNSDQRMETSDGYARLLPSQMMQLCLLNIRQVSDLSDIRAFYPASDAIKVEVLSAARVEQLNAQAANARSVSNLKQIGLGLIQYTQDYDEKLPPMRSAQSMAQIKAESQQPFNFEGLATVQRVLYPYIKNPELFAHPTTREIYRPNLNLSGRPLVYLEPPEKVVAFYEASPAADGTRAVLYLDGHVKRELETDWPAIRAASDALAPPLNFKTRVSGVNSASDTVTLYGAAALAYTVKQWLKNPAHTQPVYISKSTGRAYYRDDKTHQAHFIDPPTQGIKLPAQQAAEFREFKGYSGQIEGRSFPAPHASAATYTPRIKTALGANAALQGAMINVDVTDSDDAIVLRGTATSQAQKALSEAIARKNAPGARIINQLEVGR